MTSEQLGADFAGSASRRYGKGGSHLVVRLGDCRKAIPVHSGKDIPAGTMGAIRRSLRPCLEPEDFDAVFS